MDCDENVSETTFALTNESIFPTASLSHIYEPTEDTGTQATQIIDGSSLRRPRSGSEEIVPTRLLQFDPRHSTSAVAEEHLGNVF